MNWSEMTSQQRDTLIAEKIMGLRVHHYPAVILENVDKIEIMHTPGVPVIVDEQGFVQGKLAAYSTDMNAAWLVLQKVAGPSGYYSLASDKEKCRLDVFAEGLLKEASDGHEIYPEYKAFESITTWTPERIVHTALMAHLSEFENMDIGDIKENS